MLKGARACQVAFFGHLPGEYNAHAFRFRQPHKRVRARSHLRWAARRTRRFRVSDRLDRVDHEDLRP
jgi:hypothetical protein